ncbi:MAG: hypothetical protein JWP27_416 [Flaviaesturariibacter sp.]|nr:hypothetical protein [Flaviaesturariibacter sp.]
MKQNRVPILALCLAALLALSAQGQTALYGDHLLPYADRLHPGNQDHRSVWLVTAGRNIHLWRFNGSTLSVSVYDAALRFRSETRFPEGFPAPVFLGFGSFYYLVASNVLTTKLYRVDADGHFTDRTKALEDSLGRPLGAYEVLAGSKSLYLVRLQPDTLGGPPSLSAIVLDTGLHVRSLIERPLASAFSATTAQDDLILFERAVRGSAVGISLSRYDRPAQQFRTVHVFPEGLQYLSHRLLVSQGGLILHSLVREVGNAAANSYLLWMNTAMSVTHSLYLGDSAARGFSEPGFLFRPMMSAVLASGGLLLIDRGRQQKGAGEMLRFTWVDSAGNVTRLLKQPVDGGADVPPLLVQNAGNAYVFYAEKLRRNRSILYTYILGDHTQEERLLPLAPQFTYALEKAVEVGPGYFVMPYFDRYRVGLVRVSLHEK